MRPHLRALRPAATLLAVASCATPTPEEVDRTAFLEHMPRSVLVLPPLEETPDANAPYGWLATVTRPLAERGYYVFPVAIVDAMMKENGLPTPGEMHQVSLSKLGEVFGADAVLYVDIQEWGTSYQILNSQSRVTIRARLVDVKSGTDLWRGGTTAMHNTSDSNQNGIAGLLAGAIVNQIATAAMDPMPDLSRQANWSLIHDPWKGLLLGPRHPGFEEDQKKHRAAPAAPAPAAPAPGAPGK